MRLSNLVPVLLMTVAVQVTAAQDTAYVRLPNDSSATAAFAGIAVLSIKIDRPDSLATDSLAIRFTLTNRSDTAVALCVGKTRQFIVIQDAADTTVFFSRLSDHEWCVGRHRLAPGASTAWQDKLLVPVLAPGSLLVAAAVALIDESDCSPIFGCARAYLRSAPIAVTVRPMRSNQR
jgi:hypothetical protein